MFPSGPVSAMAISQLPLQVSAWPVNQPVAHPTGNQLDQHVPSKPNLHQESSSGEEEAPQPKRKWCAAETRMKALQAVLSGKTHREAAEMYNVHPGTLSKWKIRYEKTGSLATRRGMGKRCKLTEEEKEKLVQFFRDHPEATNKQGALIAGKKIRPRSVTNYLRRAGIQRPHAPRKEDDAESDDSETEPEAQPTPPKRRIPGGLDVLAAAVGAAESAAAARNVSAPTAPVARKVQLPQPQRPGAPVIHSPAVAQPIYNMAPQVPQVPQAPIPLQTQMTFMPSFQQFQQLPMFPPMAMAYPPSQMLPSFQQQPQYMMPYAPMQLPRDGMLNMLPGIVPLNRANAQMY
eukprot:TRINITY_DN10596_c0_g1_i1.p1 TRINITY_DN10596_c0_g1~~TRINITY_DN10596_c0_g1_i1.p1  ORF type:complete len:346 (-),score=55.84 TRINITY_DN10596_c0_g1_i1:879-1916(-)